MRNMISNIRPITDHITKFRFEYLLILLILSFFVFNFPALHLPFYWDEAWVYGPAVRMMADTVPSLLPDGLPVEFSRGHPLLFHFLNAVWLNLFGNNVFQAHLFNLLIACALIMSVYLTGKKLFNPFAGFLAALFLSFQPVFMAQAVLVLPEVMLTLFVLLALFAFLQNKMYQYLIFATGALLTKESGILVPVFVTACYIIKNLISSKISRKDVLSKTALYISPLLIFASFLFLQHKIHGWYFFPEHTGYLDFSIKAVMNKFIDGYSAYLFIYQGRNFLFFSSLAALILIKVFHKKIDHGQTMIFLVMFIMIYLLFSSINFFSNRYILCCLPLFLLISAGILVQIFRINKLFLLVTPVFILLQIPAIMKKSNADHDLGYRDAVTVNTQLISYMKAEKLEDEPIVAFFITRYLLTNHYSGYLEKGEEFKNVTDEFSRGDYYIFSNFDTSPSYDELMNKPGMNQVSRFEKGKAWIALFQYNK